MPKDLIEIGSRNLRANVYGVITSFGECHNFFGSFSVEVLKQLGLRAVESDRHTPSAPFQFPLDFVYNILNSTVCEPSRRIVYNGGIGHDLLWA